MPTIRPALAQQAQQGMHLSASFLRALEVLQLDASALVAEIDAECARNETLRVVPRDRVKRGDPDLRQSLLAAAEDRPPDLLSHVRSELAVLDLAPGLAERVLALAGLLDERGYLPADDRVLGSAAGQEWLPTALAVLQAIAPRGIGARGPLEALLLQVPSSDPDRPVMAAILREHLEDLAAGRRDRVAARLEIDRGELDEVLLRIRALDPAPGARFRTVVPEPAQPDLEVRVEGGRVKVSLADGSLPSLAVDRKFAKLATDSTVAAAPRRALARKLRSARSLMRAVAQRGETLQRVGAAVFAEQMGFFRHGAAGIRRVRMGTVAEELGLHCSTVSRAVAHKTVWTPHGLLSLREFFEVAGRGPTSAERDALVRAIRESLVSDSTLSDAAVAVELARRGLAVARRTVGKYRALLGLPRARRADCALDPES